MTSSDAGPPSRSSSSPTEPSPMPMLSPTPSLTPSPLSTTSDNSNHWPFEGGLLSPVCSSNRYRGRLHPSLEVQGSNGQTPSSVRALVNRSPRQIFASGHSIVAPERGIVA